MVVLHVYFLVKRIIPTDSKKTNLGTAGLIDNLNITSLGHINVMYGVRKLHNAYYNVLLTDN